MKLQSFACLLAFVACSGDRAPVLSHPALSPAEPLVAEEPQATAPPDRTIDTSKVDRSKVDGLLFEAKPAATATAPPKTAPRIEPLAEKDVEALLARLPPIQIQAGDQQTFAVREGPKPPARTGATVVASFPPPSQSAPPPVAQPALDVVRMQPQGPVAIAGHLSITFSQPMIAVEIGKQSAQRAQRAETGARASPERDPKTDDALSAEKVPVKLEPQPPGQWRWAGTRTLMFEAKPRFPMATEYTLTIAAGVRSAVGGKLDEPRTYRFSTPPPSVTSFRPTGDSQPLDPLLWIELDQKVDPRAVLQTVSVKAAGKKIDVALAPKERIAKEINESYVTDRMVFLSARRPFAKNTPVVVTVGPKTPSAEGPLTSKEPARYEFRTYGPLRYVEHQCEWQRECTPDSSLVVRFNNSIDIDRDQRSLVTIAPKPADTTIEISGTEVRITGAFEPEAKYTVTVAGALTDGYGQTLGHAKQVTFKMGQARPILYAPGERFVVLNPQAKAAAVFPIYTVRHPQVHLRMFKVTPEDWFQYLRWLDDYDGSQKVKPPGTMVLDRNVPIARGTLVTTQLDLAPALTKLRGNVVIEVEPANRRPDRDTEKIRRWIQVTELGLDAVIDHEDLYAFATTLAEGKPLAGVQIAIAPVGPQLATDATGHARLPLAKSGGQTSSILIAKHGDQIAFLPETQWSAQGTSWIARTQSDSYRFFLFDDRGLYRPGEPIHFKGWARLITGGKGSDVAAVGKTSPIHWVMRDSRNVEIAKGETQLSALGGFSFAAVLPKNVNLGWARAEIRAKELDDGAHASYAFQIEEFRRPEFEVSAEASEGPHLVGQWAELSVSAKYYSGGPLGDASVRWDLIAQPASYAPPNREDYSFGIWTPWWGHYDFIDRDPARSTKQVMGKTAPDGTHQVRIDLLAADPPRAMTLSGHAAVQDLNQQTWAASASIVVHPSSVYVGLKPSRSFFVLGEKIGMDAIRVDLEGKIAPGKVTLSAAPIWRDGDAQSCERSVESDAPVTCEFEANAGGPWRISASTSDDRDRPTRSERVIWIAGGPPPAEVNLTQQNVELIPDRDSYAVGDVAELMVRTPFAPAEALVTLRRQGVLRAERISLPDGSAVVRVPIEEAHLPNLNVEVDAVGANDKRPAFARGSISLRIPPLLRTLSVELLPEDPIVEPGAKTAVALMVKDAKGAAVEGAEAAVFVVDEAVLALARYQTPDPIPTFYPTRGDGTVSLHLRSEILVPSPPSVEVSRRLLRLSSIAIEGKMGKKEKAAEMADNAPPAPPPPPGQQIRVRSNFSPLAVFSPEVKTDREGRARVEITMPDNLTRYRVMAVAVAGGKLFGSSESTITAKKALMVRPSPPRFLNYGDRFELAVVVQNQTNREIPTAVFLRAANATIEAPGVLVRVPPQDRALVSFPARAEKPGIARFQIGIAAGGFDDAAELSLPVWTPATTEAFATYGELDQGAMRQPIGIPENVEPSFGALELQTSSTQMQALTDALIYLASYPFGCSEQIASRVLGVAALKDVLAAFEAEQLPPAAEIEAAVQRDVKRLEELQNWDGGWGFWKKGDASWPFNSIHVMHALIRAREKSFAVPDTIIANGQRYLRSIEQHIPREYSASSRIAIEAYALYVRAMAGDIDEKQASALIERAGGVEKMSLEVLGWIYPVLADSNAKNELVALRRALDNRATETAGTAHFATSYEEGGAYLVLHSDRRADGLLLEGLIRDQPNSTLIPKLVRGLLAHRTAGRWSNTQENAWVLLGLDRYFRTFEKATPDFVARAWLGDQLMGEHEFRGRTTERHQVEVPMSHLMSLKSERDLILAKEGAGRLYYRIGLRYAPSDLILQPKKRGFEVERKYEAIDDPQDVTRDPDGTWRIQAGARVRILITMTATGRRTHVALIDPLPAGLEPMNPALGMADVPNEQRPWWMWRWYEHQNLRDERAEAFTSLLDAGVHGYAYVARATTVGTFVAPPAVAEEMYAPETFGRSGTDRVVVAAKP